MESDRVTGDNGLVAKAHVTSVNELEQLIDRMLPLGATNTAINQFSPGGTAPASNATCRIGRKIVRGAFALGEPMRLLSLRLGFHLPRASQSHGDAGDRSGARVARDWHRGDASPAVRGVRLVPGVRLWADVGGSENQSRPPLRPS